MIIDTLQNAALYHGLGTRFIKAFQYLQETDFSKVEKGHYEIDGSAIVAIVNEYDTIPTTGEQMESHRKYIDIQYIVSGEELIGHDFLSQQQPSKPYSDTEDFMLWSEAPAFFSKLQHGMFAIFFPTDLHMPNIKIADPVKVKKVVMKVSVE
ncbi:YhcH/YjgK/YiaL family protein [Chitinophaga rhizophila]|uniref:YhcH/YjgK/YiaL family protein n=1 Tax=Chitinophaga rhizophila TaxID=2866212 RepID=A0ABS7GGX3_9BACT|nr:YhcH/YjgK/YiaL family protein [Chitinophaga rhizophila]MBW8686928.1 YhcH/YjgK/YiaL family protein [Chitinophaga rhizophila]